MPTRKGKAYAENKRKQNQAFKLKETKKGTEYAENMRDKPSFKLRNETKKERRMRKYELRQF